MRLTIKLSVCLILSIVAILPAQAVVEDSFFYIRIFDGFMPVPARYGVDTEPVEGRPAIRLISPVTMGEQPAVGYVEAGKRPVDAPEPFSQDNEINIRSRSNHDGLKIILFDYKNVDGVTGAYIYTDKAFILIVDEDPDLWRSMLDAFLPAD